MSENRLKDLKTQELLAEYQRVKIIAGLSQEDRERMHPGMSFPDKIMDVIRDEAKGRKDFDKFKKEFK